MKKTALFLLLLVAGVSLQATPSYFGLTGLNFIPTPQLPASFALAQSSKPAAQDNFTIYPYSLRASVRLFDFFELALTNTNLFFLHHDQEYLEMITVPGHGFMAAEASTGIPYTPSVKLAFADPAIPNGSVGVGFEFPYGLFLNLDYRITFLKDFDLLVVAGGATTFITIHAFGGLELRVPGGFSFQAEGAVSANTDDLRRLQEMFGAVGVHYAISRGVDTMFVLRMDMDGIRRLYLGLSVTGELFK